MSIVKSVLVATALLVAASAANASNENLLSGYHGNTPPASNHR
jgi:hypothetical protein